MLSNPQEWSEAAHRWEVEAERLRSRATEYRKSQAFEQADQADYDADCAISAMRRCKARIPCEMQLKNS